MSVARGVSGLSTVREVEAATIDDSLPDTGDLPLPTPGAFLVTALTSDQGGVGHAAPPTYPNPPPPTLWIEVTSAPGLLPATKLFTAVVSLAAPA